MSAHWRRVMAAMAATTVWSFAGSTRAQLDHVEIDSRYRVVLRELERGEPAMERWWYGWTVGYGVAAVGQTAAALLVEDEGLRIDSAVGAASSWLAFGAMFVDPRTSITAASELRAMDASSPRARELRLGRAEDLLRTSADEARAARSWFPHVAGMTVTLAGSSVLWIGYQRHLSGWINLLAGTLITEAQILTRPTGALASEQSYFGRSAWMVFPAPNGASLVGWF
jgi:hypothetical protein